MAKEKTYTYYKKKLTAEQATKELEKLVSICREKGFVKEPAYHLFIEGTKWRMRAESTKDLSKGTLIATREV